MKVTIVSLLLVAVSAYAVPEQYVDVKDARQERFVENQIRRAIEDASQSIRDAGLDPLLIDRLEYEATPFPFFSVFAFIDELKFTGASNIAINTLDFSLLLNRLRFNLSLPRLSLSVGDAGVVANVVGTRYSGELRGSLSITQIRLSGEVRVNVGIITGISIRSLFVNFDVQNIQSDLNLILLNNNLSDYVNNFLNVTIPQLLTTYRGQIDQFLTNTIRAIADEVLSRNVIALESPMVN